MSPVTRSLWITVALGVITPVSPGWAQTGRTASFTPEVFGTMAWGHVFRFEDRTFGDRPNVGAGFGILHRSGFGAEFEMNTTLGLKPQVVPCAIAGVVCVGTGRDGVHAAAIFSGNVVYRFGVQRVQPFLSGGIGGLRSRTVTSVTIVQGGQAIVRERPESGVGVALSFGGGLRVPINRNLALRSELRIYDGSLRSPANLAVIRVSAGLGYQW